MRLSQRATARLRATARSTASAQRSDEISFGATAPTRKSFRLAAKALPRPNHMWLSLIELRLVQELQLEDPMRSLLELRL